MGFEVPADVYVLHFTDPSYEGLIVRCTAPSVGVVKKITSLQGRARDLLRRTAESIDDVTDEEIAELDYPINAFVAHLVSWNLQARGEPVPPTMEGLATLPHGFAQQLMQEWLKNVQGVPDPLEPKSTNGRQLVGLQIPMETR